MRLIDFKFEKICGEKKEEQVRDFKLQSNIDLKTIQSIKDKKSKMEGDLLEIKFGYSIKYSEFAKIELEGKLVIKAEESESKDILKEWKNKKLPEEFKFIIFNLILTKSNVRALQMEDELKIPYHISLPKLENKKKE